jgi:putative ABC transport system permease protein
LLAGTLYGVQPGDPLILACACCIMVITSLAAAYVPALRAASVDPMQALRSE